MNNRYDTSGVSASRWLIYIEENRLLRKHAEINDTQKSNEGLLRSSRIADAWFICFHDKAVVDIKRKQFVHCGLPKRVVSFVWITFQREFTDTSIF